jgi:hypothetical protein
MRCFAVYSTVTVLPVTSTIHFTQAKSDMAMPVWRSFCAACRPPRSSRFRCRADPHARKCALLLSPACSAQDEASSSIVGDINCVVAGVCAVCAVVAVLMVKQRRSDRAANKAAAEAEHWQVASTISDVDVLRSGSTVFKHRLRRVVNFTTHHGTVESIVIWAQYTTARQHSEQRARHAVR